MGRLAFLLPRFPRREAHAIRPTMTHSRRQREVPPAFWPLSFSLSAPHPPLALSSTDSQLDPEHGGGGAVFTTQDPHLCPVPAGINVSRREAAVNLSRCIPCPGPEITRARRRIESDQDWKCVAPRSAARPDPTTVDESIFAVDKRFGWPSDSRPVPGDASFQAGLHQTMHQTLVSSQVTG